MAETALSFSDLLFSWDVPVAKSRTKPRKGKVWETDELIPAGGHPCGRLREPRVSRAFFEQAYDDGLDPRHIRCADYEICLEAACEANLNANQTWRCSKNCPGWATSILFETDLPDGEGDEK